MWLLEIMLRRLVLVLCLVGAGPLHAAQGVIDLDTALRGFFPQAERVGEFTGEPKSAAVYRGDKIIGYLFVTNDVVRIPAYSGKPVNMLVGIDMQGVIANVKVLEHHEPILLVGIPEKALFDFVAQYIGKSVTDRVKVGSGTREGYVNVDAVTGATVTVIVVNQSIMRSARRVAEAVGIIAPTAEEKTPPARVRKELFNQADWKFLTGDGSIRRLLLHDSEVDAAFASKQSAPALQHSPACEAPVAADACDVFIDLYYAYLNVPTIGRNLLGETQYNWLMAELKPGEHAIALLANGKYSFKGSGYVRGGIFDRIQVFQGENSISFRDRDYYRLNDVYAAGMPGFKEMAIYIVRNGYDFDPGRTWRLELLVRRQIGPLESIFTSFSGDYLLPAPYVEFAEPVVKARDIVDAVWLSVWKERGIQIGVLVAGLFFLVLVLLFQDWLTKRPKLLEYIRNGFLLFAVLFIGWYSLAQLSVVNVLVFVKAFMGDFRWDTFLIDPMMFIQWSFVAVTLLLWGRGVYCGWLCPFGALQELVNKVARRLKIKQFDFPLVVHERLWVLKYVILLLLFGLSLQSIAEAERYAEIEPFKTAITLHFQRDVEFVLYAVALVLISIVNGKFYCKYLCPLGAALAFPARMRLFDWLRRRKECGRPCQTCANDCEVQAIRSTGEINANECHYCLDCQVTYWDEYKCMPLIDKRKRREKHRKGGAAASDDASGSVTVELS